MLWMRQRSTGKWEDKGKNAVQMPSFGSSIGRLFGIRPKERQGRRKEIMGCFCYIVECADGTYYTGWTTDPQRRAEQHNRGRGARYTSHAPPGETGLRGSPARPFIGHAP